MPRNHLNSYHAVSEDGNLAWGRSYPEYPIPKDAALLCYSSKGPKTLAPNTPRLRIQLWRTPPVHPTPVNRPSGYKIVFYLTRANHEPHRHDDKFHLANQYPTAPSNLVVYKHKQAADQVAQELNQAEPQHPNPWQVVHLIYRCGLVVPTRTPPRKKAEHKLNRKRSGRKPDFIRPTDRRGS